MIICHKFKVEHYILQMCKLLIYHKLNLLIMKYIKQIVNFNMEEPSILKEQIIL